MKLLQQSGDSISCWGVWKVWQGRVHYLKETVEKVILELNFDEKHMFTNQMIPETREL